MTLPTAPLHLAVAFPAPVHGRADLSAASPAGPGAPGAATAPLARDLVDFRAYIDFARTAERGGFDLLLLGEDLRLRAADEVNDAAAAADPSTAAGQTGRAGRPDALTVLAALASVTDRLGLAATATTTFSEPYALARRLATLDHLSGGRAAWNAVTTLDAEAGANYRRGLVPRDADRARADSAARVERTREFLAAALSLFDSWADSDLALDPATGTFLANPRAGSFAYRREFFDIAGRFNVPRSPQGRPPILLTAAAADDEQARRQRELAAATADIVTTPYAGLDAGLAFRADLRERLARRGRSPEHLLVLPTVPVALRATDAGTGPVGGAFSFSGTAETVARNIVRDVRAGAADGFVLVPPVRPRDAGGLDLVGGLAEFVDTVIPALRAAGERGADEGGTTLRARLGLPPVPDPGARGPADGTAAVSSGEITAGAVVGAAPA